MAQIEAMLVDVGDVMIRLKRGKLFECLREHCTRLDEAEMEAALHVDGTGIHVDYEMGKMDFDGFYSELVKRFGLQLEKQAFLAQWQDYFLPNRPMDALVGRLGRQVRWWGLSNTNAEHYARFKQAFRVFDVFEEVMGSFQLGLRKPDPEIFKVALNRIGLPPVKVFYVDDLLPNVEAAREAGMPAFHYQFNDLELQQALRELGLELPPREGRSDLAC